MPLRIVIDARRIHDFGIGTYIRNLIRNLSKLDRESEYIILTARTGDPEFAGLGDNFTIAPFNPRPKSVFQQLSLPLLLRRFSADVYHVPLNAVPWGMPDPYVVTVHDMGSLLFAEKRNWRTEVRLSRFRRGLANAARVIAVSNATRHDVETLVGIPPNRVRTIYNAIDPEFSHSKLNQTSEVARILDRYQIHYPFLLYAGRTHPPKNIPRLVEAFAVLRGEIASHPVYKNLRLIIIGDEISKYPSLRHAVIQSRVEDVVRFLGFVPIGTLRVFYQAAAAFVFPSLYEGFGLPPLEAMACGTPVVTSNVSALPEVVGEAAWIVNPEHVFDIARGIREVLLDEQLREMLIRRGREQVKRFSWECTAAQVLETYKEVAGLAGR
ncbi:MAG: glycosyltransferase family 4 protein [Acidobacteriaceae bacterium]|nr:glycosyltransferase family 4 protein [Acidobacteriaceae bacterium]